MRERAGEGADRADARRLAVLGSPIAHSKSPALHAAAYAVLGLRWRYDAIEMTGERVAAFVAGLSPKEWVGLSLTMPLKRDVLPALAWRSPLVELTHAANTVRIEPDGARGFNTDVAGIVDALADHGVRAVGRAHILGTGATAASALVALSRIGAREVLVSGRGTEPDAELARLAAELGVPVSWRRYGEPVPFQPELLVNTLPGGVEPDDRPEADDGEVLLEVPYDPWPSARVERWRARGHEVVSGLEMLLHQAVGQVRIFVTGREDGPLDRETEVVAAMRRAVGLQGS